jgi:hypothetical protein
MEIFEEVGEIVLLPMIRPIENYPEWAPRCLELERLAEPFLLCRIVMLIV